MTNDYEALAAEVEASGGCEGPLAAHVSESIAELPGLEHFTDEDTSSTDALLHAIDLIVPSWSIHLRGSALEPDGHWQCTLRRSEDRDNDEFVGTGKGPRPAVLLETCGRRPLVSYWRPVGLREGRYPSQLRIGTRRLAVVTLSCRLPVPARVTPEPEWR